MMAGLQKGLLNNDMVKLGDKCFDLETNDDIQFGYLFMTRQRPITDVVKFTTKTVGIINSSMENCGYTGSVKMLQDFCRYHYTPQSMLILEREEDDDEDGKKQPKARCSESTLIRNFYTRIFNHMYSYFTIAELWGELWYEVALRLDGPTIYLSCLGIGREVGKMVRTIFEFAPPDDFEYNIDPWMSNDN